MPEHYACLVCFESNRNLRFRKVIDNIKNQKQSINALFNYIPRGQLSSANEAKNEPSFDLEAISDRLRAWLDRITSRQISHLNARVKAIAADIHKRLKVLNDFHNKCDVEEAKKRLRHERIIGDA